MDSEGPTINTSWISFLWTQLVYEGGEFTSVPGVRWRERQEHYSVVFLYCVVWKNPEDSRIITQQLLTVLAAPSLPLQSFPLSTLPHGLCSDCFLLGLTAAGLTCVHYPGLRGVEETKPGNTIARALPCIQQKFTCWHCSRLQACIRKPSRHKPPTWRHSRSSEGERQ